MNLAHSNHELLSLFFYYFLFSAGWPHSRTSQCVSNDMRVFCAARIGFRIHSMDVYLRGINRFKRSTNSLASLLFPACEDLTV